MSNIVDFIEPYDAYTCDIFNMVCGLEAYVQDMIYEEYSTYVICLVNQNVVHTMYVMISNARCNI